jgi:hypothetical protein
MSSDKKAFTQSDEPFLARWARLKKEAAAAPAPRPESPADPAAEPVALPPLESLTPDSDFSVFMGPGVQPKLRQAALRRLFTDPHFNVMDGLDIYIDDYTKPDPIAIEVIEQLVQFRNLGGVQRDVPENVEVAGGESVQQHRAAAANGPDQLCDAASNRPSALGEGVGAPDPALPDTMSQASATSGQDVSPHRSK